MSGEKALRMIVTGRVQGVSYRVFARSSAQRLGLAGWVMNRPDGAVEVRVSGPDEQIAAFKERLREGPPAGRVDTLSEESVAEGANAATDLPTPFEIRF